MDLEALKDDLEENLEEVLEQDLEEDLEVCQASDLEARNWESARVLIWRPEWESTRVLIWRPH